MFLDDSLSKVFESVLTERVHLGRSQRRGLGGPHHQPARVPRRGGKRHRGRPEPRQGGAQDPPQPAAPASPGPAARPHQAGRHAVRRQSKRAILFI